MENILSTEFIRRRAEEFVPDDMDAGEGTIRLLSIGRFSYPKRFDEVGTICRLLLETLARKGFQKRIHWYIIGFGNEAPMQENIKAENMQAYITVLGKRSNPYPYIKACDIYVQPSRYEGKSITVREAQILCKPVVVTNYPTASSQIQPGLDGMIVPMEKEACAQGMAEVLQDKALQQKMVAYLQEHDYGNEHEVEKIEQLLNR